MPQTLNTHCSAAKRWWNGAAKGIVPQLWSKIERNISYLLLCNRSASGRNHETRALNSCCDAVGLFRWVEWKGFSLHKSSSINGTGVGTVGCNGRSTFRRIINFPRLRLPVDCVAPITERHPYLLFTALCHVIPQSCVPFCPVLFFAGPGVPGVKATKK